MNHGEPRSLYDRALSVLMDGVNSPVRTAQPHLFFVECSDSAYVISADEDRYTDYVMGYGPPPYGHGTPEPVRSAIQKYVVVGPMYDTPTGIEVEYAEFVVRHAPSVEMLRFVNSDTEATVLAVRLARGVTGRDKIVVMQGGYHGAQEFTLAEGGPDGAKPPTPDTPSSFADHTIPVPFNDEETVREVFTEHGENIAAVLVEPILASTGIVHPADGYFETLHDVTEAHGVLLIFDEVITGFRVGGLQRAQSKFGVTPDLIMFGKIIGGSLPIGAVGGKTELAEQPAPGGDVFQSSIFSGHPVTMATGHEYLRYATENDAYEHVDRLGKKLRASTTGTLED